VKLLYRSIKKGGCKVNATVLLFSKYIFANVSCRLAVGVKFASLLLDSKNISTGKSEKTKRRLL
jgi:hypothetical protein